MGIIPVEKIQVNYFVKRKTKKAPVHWRVLFEYRAFRVVEFFAVPRVLPAHLYPVGGYATVGVDLHKVNAGV